MVEEVKVPNPKGRVPGHKLRDVDVLVFHDDADGDVVPVRGTEGRRREERARNWGRKATRAASRREATRAARPAAPCGVVSSVGDCWLKMRERSARSSASSAAAAALVSAAEVAAAAAAAAPATAAVTFSAKEEASLPSPFCAFSRLPRSEEISLACLGATGALCLASEAAAWRLEIEAAAAAEAEAVEAEAEASGGGGETKSGGDTSLAAPAFLPPSFFSQTFAVRNTTTPARRMRSAARQRFLFGGGEKRGEKS